MHLRSDNVQITWGLDGHNVKRRAIGRHAAHSCSGLHLNLAFHYIQDGLRHLHMTQEGQLWIANLYAQVFTVEHAEL